jgi:hypothetical protein
MMYHREKEADSSQSSSSSSSDDNDEVFVALRTEEKKNAAASPCGRMKKNAPSCRRGQHAVRFCLLGFAVGFMVNHVLFSRGSFTGTMDGRKTLKAILSQELPSLSKDGEEGTSENLACDQSSSRIDSSGRYVYTRPNITFGHVHIAKTAGTTLNGELSLRYERVCGHKGYSFDAIQHNQRIQDLQQRLSRKGVGIYGVKDSVTTVKQGFNRGRVHEAIMWERGLEDCDWISIEDGGWQSWERHLHRTNVIHQNNKLELHVPCRDPLEHLLSQCNYKQIRFQCDLETNPRQSIVKVGMSSAFKAPQGGVKNSAALTTEQQIDACMIAMGPRGRFHHNLTLVPNFELKCFDFSLHDKYIDYMGRFLQQRRVVKPYEYRSSGPSRHKEKECLLNAPEDYKQRVRNYLIERYHYYQFCDKCMGSPNDLFSKAHEAHPEC